MTFEALKYVDLFELGDHVETCCAVYLVQRRRRFVREINRPRHIRF